MAGAGEDGADVAASSLSSAVRSLSTKYSGRMEHGWRSMRDDVPALAIYLVHPTFAPFGVSPALPLRFQKPSCGKIVTSVVLLEKPPRIPAR